MWSVRTVMRAFVFPAGTRELFNPAEARLFTSAANLKPTSGLPDTRGFR
jgi:Na+-transporting NADH:ubiquinone oxidoreductase subunit NqrB